MNKSLIINVYKAHKYIAWFSTECVLSIQGFRTKDEMNIWLSLVLQRHNLLCVYGSFNECNFEIINRILKAEEIL